MTRSRTWKTVGQIFARGASILCVAAAITCAISTLDRFDWNTYDPWDHEDVLFRVCAGATVAFLIVAYLISKLEGKKPYLSRQDEDEAKVALLLRLMIALLAVLTIGVNYSWMTAPPLTPISYGSRMSF